VIKLSPTFEEAYARWREPARAKAPAKSTEPAAAEPVELVDEPFAEWADDEPTLVDRKPPPRT